MQKLSGVELADYVDMTWPPMAHVRRGWDRLDEKGRKVVLHRLDLTLGKFKPSPTTNKKALRRFFSFLSQVEVIAIEVPLSALPTATPEMRPMLERQLSDEVFHATIFAALARRLGGLDKPVPEAESLLDLIRHQEDPKTTAVLLNLIAEGWIENLFDQAVTWGVADEVFQIVLEDESRHVEEAHAHAEGMDVQKVQEAVRSFEEELFKLSQHPRVMLPVLALAGEQRFQVLGRSFLDVHKAALAEVGLEPAPRVVEMERAMEEALADGAPLAGPRPTRVEPESQWRRTALELWDAPRYPVTHGFMEVAVDHIPRHLLTAVTVAAIGRVWKEYPRMNRYTQGGELWSPPTVNVGVRVALGDKGEAISTVVITEADKRSLNDIRRMISQGVARLNETGSRGVGLSPDSESESLASILRDEELMGMMPPGQVAAPVTISNVGKQGLYAGFGSMPGLGQSVELVIGRVEKRPQWRTWRYKPVDTVIIGASADHRVFDGLHTSEAMRRFLDGMTSEGVREIMNRPDTLTDVEVEAASRAAATGQVLLSCKLPFWLGWLCWMFKK